MRLIGVGWHAEAPGQNGGRRGTRCHAGCESRQRGRRTNKKRSWQFGPSICHDLYPETGQASIPPSQHAGIISIGRDSGPSATVMSKNRRRAWAVALHSQAGVAQRTLRCPDWPSSAERSCRRRSCQAPPCRRLRQGYNRCRCRSRFGGEDGNNACGLERRKRHPHRDRHQNLAPDGGGGP